MPLIATRIVSAFISQALIASICLILVGCERNETRVTEANTIESHQPANPQIKSQPESDLPDADLPEVNFKQKKDDLLAGVSRAVCYSGYRQGQHPNRGDGAVNPSYEEVLEDLRILSRDANFMLIRVYDSGENSQTVLKVISENGLNLKVMLGVWLRAELSAHETCAWLTEPIPAETLTLNKELNRQEVDRGIQLANKYPETIVAVNVGNEAWVDWNDHKVSPESIMNYVQLVKSNIEQPVTVAENYKWWAEHGRELATAVDFISVHTYPVWEGKDIDNGMSFTLENLAEVRRAIPDVAMVIGEAGWATVASEFGSRANEGKQAEYFDQLMDWSEQMNITTFFFEAFDEDWKGDPNNSEGAEKHWGIFDIDRKPKKAMQTTDLNLRESMGIRR